MVFIGFAEDKTTKLYICESNNLGGHVSTIVRESVNEDQLPEIRIRPYRRIDLPEVHRKKMETDSGRNFFEN